MTASWGGAPERAAGSWPESWAWARLRLAALSVIVGLAAGLPAQLGEEDLPVGPQDDLSGYYGRTVHYVHVLPSTIDREQVLRNLRTQLDRRLSKAEIAEDVERLFMILNMRALKVTARKVGEDRVEVFFNLETSKYYDQVRFKGLRHLDLVAARNLGGLSQTQRTSEDDAKRLRLLLLDRYRRDGYYFASIDTRGDEVERTVTFLVDEGPRVGVNSLEFRGNHSYPGSVFLRFGQNLRGSAKLESVPGVFSDAPFSLAQVEEDLEKVELFYRRNGFLNARAHLERMDFSYDQTGVDLAFRIEEGERFRVTEVDLEIARSTNQPDPGEPQYSKEEVRKVLQIAPGDYLSSDVLKRDEAALERFYGQRGHPTARRYGQAYGNLFRIDDPLIIPDAVKPEVRVVFRLVEGEAKRLRDVPIHGNTSTLDRVIRRHVKLLPGDILDTTKLDRSRFLLDRTGYFRDPESMTEVQFRLRPVPESDEEVDLGIHLREGSTGSFTWGAGISSGLGIQGNFQYVKSNFDITRLPSSWNPADWFSEIAGNKAFHGGGQSLDLLVSPGTEISTFRVSWFEPDVFRQHMDTIGMRVDGYKTIRILDSYDTDRVGGALTLSRIFDETMRINMTLRDETVRVADIDDNAPLIVWASEGQTEIRGLELGVTISDLDNPMQPRSGYALKAYGEIAGSFLGGGEDFYKVGASMEFYRPFLTDLNDRKHVLYSRVRFDYGDTFGATDILHPGERFFMGGSNLRGFDQRRAGPSQFGQPVGGKAMLLSTFEYQFPLISTQMEGSSLHTEVIRGVVFSDFGMLGLDIDHDTFRDPRLTAGFGIRIYVPVLQVPIQLDLAWPIMAEETDHEEQLFFTLRPF